MTCRQPLLAALALAAAFNVARAEFAVGVTPPRLELTGRGGERLRQVIEISNAAAQPTTLTTRTADWTYRPDDTVEFHDELQPGSCRPWVAIERREVVIGGGQTYRFRIEISPPVGQTPVECRFALLVEGKDATAAGASVPVAGRIGVIVYVGVGGVAPELKVLDARTDMRYGRRTAAVLVRNDGAAHGRLDGFLKAVDARGTTFEVTPGTSPVLPGESRWIALNASRPGSPDEPAAPEFPITVTGKLEYGEGRTFDIDQRFPK